MTHKLFFGCMCEVFANNIEEHLIDWARLKSRRKILHVTDYPPNTGGGIAYFIRDLVAETSDLASHNVFATRKKDNVNSDPSRFVGDRLFKNYDTVVFHFTYSIRFSLLIFLFCKALGKRTVSVVHCEREHAQYGNLKGLSATARRLVTSLFERIISSSSVMVCFNADSSVHRFDSVVQCKQIVNLASQTLISHLKTQADSYALFCGDTSKLKGFDRLIPLARNNPDVAIIAVTEALLAPISSLPMNIQMVSIRQQCELQAIMENCDFGLVLSRTESWCRFAHELLLLGKPVVTTVESGVFLAVGERYYCYLNPERIEEENSLHEMLEKCALQQEASVSAVAKRINSAAIEEWRNLVLDDRIASNEK